MSDNTLVRQSARELARLIRNRAVSPIEVLDAHLAAIAALNPKLNAIVTLAEESARDHARRAEQAVMKGEPLGALHGLPVGIKDITLTAGIRTTFASPLLKDNVPSEDEEVVRRLKAAGAIVLAKTNTPEFACGANTNNALFGPTRNPWNPALSPAGSSGGSAVAVATGMTPLAQGTDYGCSIRIPAAFCGIVGIRPTPGLIPSYPKPLAWNPGEVHGPLARDAEDAALMLDAMVGFSRISPISVAPPLQSALVELERREDIKGLRNGVSLALVIIVVAEMFIGSQDGLGHSVFEAQQLFDMPRMYAAIFAAGALGYGLNLMFLLIERRFVHWSGK